MVSVAESSLCRLGMVKVRPLHIYFRVEKLATVQKMKLTTSLEKKRRTTAMIVYEGNAVINFSIAFRISKSIVERGKYEM